MFFYIVLTPISTTSGLWSSGNTRKYHQIDVYIYQCELCPFVEKILISDMRRIVVTFTDDKSYATDFLVITLTNALFILQGFQIAQGY